MTDGFGLARGPRLEPQATNALAYGLIDAIFLLATAKFLQFSEKRG